MKGKAVDGGPIREKVRTTVADDLVDTLPVFLGLGGESDEVRNRSADKTQQFHHKAPPCFVVG